jgi:hypothetical protein
MNPLQDDELNRALAGLEAPATPPQLEARTLAAYGGRKSPLRRLLTMQIRVPLPAAVAVLAALIGVSVTLSRVESRQPRKEPPVAESPQPWGGLQPVGELHPVIIRGQDENR